MFFNSIKEINRLSKKVNRLTSVFNSIKEINRLSKKVNRLLSNVFNSIKEINKLRKKINRLLSKGMWKIYIKVTIEEKNWRSQNFDVLGFKNLSPGQFSGSPNSRRHHWIFELLVAN